MPHARNRILVVDDEESSRRALRELLEDQGFAVDTAANGIAALEAAQRNPPTIVLSDVRMPRAGGFHVVQRLRATPELADTPILLMSAYTERAQRIAGLEIGADDYLTKPIDFDELMARIRIHLRHLRRRRGLERRASRDSLTHVLNRGGLMASLRRHQVRARRAHTAVTVLLIDIDDFKALNDTHGHAAGDAALREIARGLVHEVRADDHVGRLGGDEFVVIVDGDETAAAPIARRLRRQTLVSVDGGQEIDVSCSVGIAQLRPGETVDAALARADAAMYGAKRAGLPG